MIHRESRSGQDSRTGYRSTGGLFLIFSSPIKNVAAVMAGLLLYGLQTGYAYTRASALPYDSGAMLFGTGLMLTASDEYSIHAYDSRLP